MKQIIVEHFYKLKTNVYQFIHIYVIKQNLDKPNY